MKSVCEIKSNLFSFIRRDCKIVAGITNYQVVLFWFPEDSGPRVIYCFLSKALLNKSFPLVYKMLMPVE